MAKDVCVVQLEEFYSDPLNRMAIEVSAKLIRSLGKYMSPILPNEIVKVLTVIATAIEKWVADAEAGNMTQQHVFYLCYLFSFARLVLRDYPEVFELYVELMPDKLQVFMTDCCERFATT